MRAVDDNDAMRESAAWIAANVPRRMLEATLPEMMATAGHDLQYQTLLVSVTAEFLCESHAASREAARAGGATFEAWASETETSAAELREVAARMVQTLRGFFDAMRWVEKARNARARAMASCIEDHGPIETVSLQRVVASALEDVGDAGAPSMPAGLEPGVFVLASPAALRALLARLFTLAARAGQALTLTVSGDEDVVRLTLQVAGGQTAAVCGGFERFLHGALARAAGHLEQHPSVRQGVLREFAFARA